MSVKTARVLLTADPAGLEAGMARAAAVTDASAKAMGDSMDGATTRVGNSVSGLGSKLSALGIPGASAFDKIGSKIGEADTKGQKFGQTVSTLGGVTLAAGAIGFAAFAGAAVDFADKFDVAQTQLQVAVKNSGGNFDKLKPSIDSTYGSMAKLGFNSTTVAGSLTALVTSTGSTKKAEGDLAIAADLARAKHISLESATSILTKTLAGSTRGLTTLGINLDIGSGKLKTIATDTTAAHNAQSNLDLVQKQVANGTLKGADAYAKLLAAHEAVDTTTQKLTTDQGTIGKILDTVKDKTQGAATAYGDTLAGKMDTAKAEVHNLTTSFGEELLPVIDTAISDVTSLVNWFDQHKTAAEALAIAIGTVLAGAVTVYSVNTAVGMVNSTKSALSSLGIFKGAATDTATSTEQLNGSTTELAAAIDRLSSQVTPATADLTGLTIATDRAGESAVITAAELDTLGANAEGAGGKMALAGGAQGAAGLETGLKDAAGAGEGMGATFGGPVVIGVAAAAFGLAGLGVWLSSNKQAWQTASSTALNYADTTLPDLINKMGLLHTALDQNDSALKTLKKSTDDQTGASHAEGFSSNETAQHTMALKNNHDALTTAINQTREATQQYNSNLTILEGTFGVTQGQAINLAQAAGVNLHGALTTANLDSINAQSGISAIGTQADTTSGKISSMGTYAAQALDALASKLKSTGTAADWGQLGQDIDFGIGNGITANSVYAINAAQGMVQQVITASRTGLKAASPSRVFFDLGQGVAQGFAGGVDAQAHLATNSVNSMVNGLIPSVPNSISAGISPVLTGAGAPPSASTAGGAAGGTQQFNLILDGVNVGRVLLPILQTAGALYQRTVPQPVFGVANGG